MLILPFRLPKFLTQLAFVLATVAVFAGCDSAEIRERLKVQSEILKESAVVLTESVFKVRQVSVRGLFHVPRSEVVSLLIGEEGVWLWQLSRSGLAAKLSEHPWIQSAKIDVSVLPPRFEVEISEEQPYLVAEFGQGSWLVSKNGKLISPLKDLKDPEIIMQSLALPRLSGEISRVAGEPNREEVRKSATILRLYQSAGGFPFPLERAERARDGSLRIFSPDPNHPTILIGETDFEGARRALLQLERASRDLSARGESARAFDLRFQGQVVVTPQTISLQ